MARQGHGYLYEEIVCPCRSPGALLHWQWLPESADYRSFNSPIRLTQLDFLLSPCSDDTSRLVSRGTHVASDHSKAQAMSKPGKCRLDHCKTGDANDQAERTDAYRGPGGSN